jgi:flavin-binding protein dodecin
MGRISEAWPIMTPPGAVYELRPPVRFLRSRSQIDDRDPCRTEDLNCFAFGGHQMEDHVYKVLELVGSSEKSIEDAIQNAITRASKTLRDMKWFEVLETRGHIENGSVRHYQVTLKVGFTLEK